MLNNVTPKLKKSQSAQGETKMETKVYLQTLTSAPIVTLYQAPAELDAESIRESLVEFYPVLSNASFTETVEGDVRTLLFTEIFGDKGNFLL